MKHSTCIGIDTHAKKNAVFALDTVTGDGFFVNACVNRLREQGTGFSFSRRAVAPACPLTNIP